MAVDADRFFLRLPIGLIFKVCWVGLETSNFFQSNDVIGTRTFQCFEVSSFERGVIWDALSPMHNAASCG